jgi:hypothetical protein
MVLTTQGKNLIRDLIDADLSQGELGTDNSAPSETDTGLGTPIAATIKSLTTATTDKQISMEYTLDSVTGNGNTYTEFENQVAGGGINRVTFAGIAKNSAMELNVVTVLFIK